MRSGHVVLLCLFLFLCDGTGAAVSTKIERQLLSSTASGPVRRQLAETDCSRTLEPIVQKVNWGGIGMVKAHRSLMRAALEDPLNQQFQLLCDTAVPIRQALFSYVQLIGHPASRLANLHKGGRDPKIGDRGRFHADFYEAWPDLAKFRAQHSQWVTLKRQHAMFVVEDTTILSHFEKHCYQSPLRDDSYCIPDEQYVGTVVHTRIQDSADADDSIIVLRLNSGQGFGPEAVTEEFLLETRGSVSAFGIASSGNGGAYQGDWHAKCQDITHRPQIDVVNLQDPHCWFPPIANSSDPNWSDKPRPFNTSTIELHAGCYLFVRKFAPEAANAVASMWAQLGIVSPGGDEYVHK